MSRPWLALVLALFCLPLFVGLGGRDLQNDEAIYSFAVDRILDDGDWLEPKLSPHDDLPFLEKPPLKFWIVAAPIAGGVLPRSEFGLRFWDAAFGGLAFVYVFLLGTRLINPVAGAVAVMALFAHSALLFTHGLRDNAMEAPLVLAYCGGAYHFLAWASKGEPVRARRHAVAVALYFVLGFMVKFVAAIFLPVALAVSVLLVGDLRQRVKREWRLWAMASALAAGLVAPWFAYAHVRYGEMFWRTLLDEHVYRRFTSALDVDHLEPWYYYGLAIYQRLSDSGVAVLAAAGMAGLAWQAMRRCGRPRVDAVVLIVWATLPVAAISVGTSKIYHYAYPFLPPFALAAGYAVALAFALAPAPFERVMSAIGARVQRDRPRLAAFARTRTARAALITLAVASIALALVSLVIGQVRLDLGGGVIFRSTGIFRPAVLACLCLLSVGLAAKGRRVVLMVLLVSMLPLPGYRASLARLTAEEHPLRTLTDCMRRVDAEGEGAGRGLQVLWPDADVWHPVHYYFRRVQPWVRGDAAALTHVDDARPILLRGEDYRRLDPAVRNRLPRPASIEHDGRLILPGAFAACADTGF